MKKILAMLLAVLMVVSMFAGCKEKETTAGTYTYHTYTTALADNWNPHTWETNGDSAVMDYLETPLTDITIKDSATGEYQWIFVAAESIEDVTKDHQDDLAKYGSVETDATEGYVYEIKLRPEMKWQDGTAINADTYIYSMQQMLNPQMRNYRANTYFDGDGAIAGAKGYYNQGAPIYACVVPAYGENEEGDYSFDVEAAIEAGTLYIGGDDGSWTLYTGMSLNALYANYGAYFTEETCATIEALSEGANSFGYTQITEENWEDVQAAFADILMSLFGVPEEAVEMLTMEGLFYDTGDVSEAVEWDTVGLYKVDNYTIRYVCETSYDYYYFLTSCTSNWLVHEELYESCKSTADNGLISSNYGTSLATTMSYGAYKMTSLEDAKQIVFEQNENYWEYTKNSDGTLSSTTFFEVDGQKVPQYQTQKIVMDVMTDDAAKLAFLSGELDDWALSAEDARTYSTSEQLYQVDETYTMRLFFNDDLDALKAMDEDGGNTNSVVMSNYKFRQAFSLAINRAEYVTATAGYKPAYYLLNSLYFYDVYEDPTSIYRNSDVAKQAICNLYGVAYGEGTPYADLDAAYDSITGYNLTEAQALMTEACNELVDAGLYTKGEDIVIEIGWSKGAIDSSGQQQVALLNQFLNEALKDTGFGSIELVAVDNVTDRYGDVVNGTFAIGYGAWGGAAFYPFNAIGCYTDPDYAGQIHESGSWDPTLTNLTLTVDGEEITMTYQAWTQSLTGVGEYAGASNEVRLQILAGLEENLLKLYHCIPLATSTSCSMLSYKISYYTENYSIMYGFGGLRLLKYNYSDAEWDSYVASQNNSLGY